MYVVLTLYPQEVEALIRPASNTKSSVLKLKDHNVKIHVAEIKDGVQLAIILASIDTVISTIGPRAWLDQIFLADSAKKQASNDLCLVPSLLFALQRGPCRYGIRYVFHLTYRMS
jgi:hypothetical protein